MDDLGRETTEGIAVARKENPQIKVEAGGAEIRLSDVTIRPEDEIRLFMITRRNALPVKDGDTVGPLNRPVIVDNQGKLAELRQQAKMLQSIPDKERLEKLMELVRKTLVYVRSKDQIQHLSSARQVVASRRWLDDDPGLRDPESLSQIVEDGLGVCNEFAALYLVLANDAGLRGINHFGNVKNQPIVGTKEPIFKSQPIGSGDFHSWLEIQLENGVSIPVDPTAGLIGDTPNTLETFNQAYKGRGITNSFVPFLTGLPEGLTFNRLGEEFFYGEVEHQGFLRISLAKNPDGTPRLPNFKGDLSFSIKPRVDRTATKSEIFVKEVKTI